jgi:hypothetical protein
MTAGLFDYIEKAFADEILTGAINSAMNKIDDCAEIADAASGAGSAVLMCGPSSAPRWDRWLGFGFPAAYLFRMLHLSFEASPPEWCALLPLQELQEGFHHCQRHAVRPPQAAPQGLSGGHCRVLQRGKG